MSTDGSGKGEDFGDNNGSSERRLSKRDRKPPKRFIDDDIYNQPQQLMANNKKARNGENASDNMETALVPYDRRVSTRKRQPVKKFPADEDDREFQLIPGTWNPSAERAARDFYRAKYLPSVNIDRLEVTSTSSSNVSNETSETESETPARRVSTRVRKPLRLSLRDDSSTSSGSQLSKTRKTGKKAQKKKVPGKTSKRAAGAKKDAESQTETGDQKNAGDDKMEIEDSEGVKGPVVDPTHPEGQQNATDKTNFEEKALTLSTEKKTEEQPCCSKSLPKITFEVFVQDTVEPVDRPAPCEGPEPTNKGKDADKAVDTIAPVTEPDVIAVPSNEPVLREPVEPPNAGVINGTAQMGPVEPPNTVAINGTAQVDPVEPPNTVSINGTAQMDPVEPPNAVAINGTAQVEPVEPPNAVAIDGTAQVEPPNAVAINGTAQVEPVEPPNAVVINGEPPNNDISNNVQAQEQNGINGHVVDEVAVLSPLHMELDTQLRGFSFYDWLGLMAIIDRHGQLPKNTARNETVSINLFCLGPACLIEVVQYINAVWMNANRLALPAPLATEHGSVGQNAPPQELQMEVPRPRYCNGVVYFGPAGVKRVPADQPSIGME